MNPTAKKQGGLAKSLPLAIPDDGEVQVWILLAHAYHRIARHLERALDEHGLSLAQFEVLARLHFDGAITQSELADRLLVTKGNVCGLLDRMAAADLVTRKADPNDRRANQLFLTKTGRDVLAQAFPKHIAEIKQLLGTLPPGEIQMLYRSLSHLLPAE